MRLVSPLLTVLVLAACGGADTGPVLTGRAVRSSARPPPVPSSAAPPATPEVHVPGRELFSLEAVDAVLRGRTLIVVDPDSRRLRALDLNNGRERWRVPLGEPWPAALIHSLGRGRLMVQVPGKELHVIDVPRGARRARRPSPPSWRFVARRGGACALRSRCTLQPVSCEDGHVLGPALRGATLDFAPMDSRDEGTPTCASSPEVLGHAGALSLYVAWERGRPRPEVVARDTAGETRWRSAAVACETCQAVGMGSAPDGSLCWTTDGAGAERVLRAFRCGDGTPLVEQHLRAARGYRHPPILTGWVDEPAGLFLTTGERAMLLSARGAVRWSRPCASDTLVMPRGLHVPSSPLALDRYARIEDVDPSTGRTRETRSPYAGAELRIDDTGQILFTPLGQTTDRGGAAIPALRIFRFQHAESGSRASIDGQVVIELAGDARVVGERTSPDGSILVVAEARPDAPDRVRVIQVDAPRCDVGCCASSQRAPVRGGTVECCFCDRLGPAD